PKVEAAYAVAPRLTGVSVQPPGCGGGPAEAPVVPPRPYPPGPGAPGGAFRSNGPPPAAGGPRGRCPPSLPPPLRGGAGRGRAGLIRVVVGVEVAPLGFADRLLE